MGPLQGYIPSVDLLACGYYKVLSFGWSISVWLLQGTIPLDDLLRYGYC